MNSQNDKFKGAINSSMGRAKQAAGRVLNDRGLENRGLAQETKGDVQKIQGTIKDKIERGSHVLGNAIEKVGKKLNE